MPGNCSFCNRPLTSGACVGIGLPHCTACCDKVDDYRKGRTVELYRYKRKYNPTPWRMPKAPPDYCNLREVLGDIFYRCFDVEKYLGRKERVLNDREM
jgi:hypothetical protein